MSNKEQVRFGTVFVRDANGVSQQQPMVAGEYTPSYMTADGRFVSAKWKGSVCITGGTQKGKWFDLTVWNGSGANFVPGTGAADKFAKDSAVGRKVVIGFEDDNYLAPTIDPRTQTAILTADGKPVMHHVPAKKYVPGTMEFGEHTPKFEEFMWNRPINGMDFFSELCRVTVPGGPNNEANRVAMIEQVFPFRAKLAYDPATMGQVYGRSLVRAIPAGATFMLMPPAGYVRPAKATAGAVGTVAGIPGIPGMTMPAINPAGVAAAVAPVAAGIPGIPTQPAAPVYPTAPTTAVAGASPYAPPQF